MTKKLTKQEWLDFSLKELTKHGHAQLSANRLCSKLGVSRGSFYWHFKDLRDFEASLLAEWSDLTTENTIQDLSTVESPQFRLLTLVQLTMKGNMKLERAIRAWATSDQSVAKAVEAVDCRRVEYIEGILRTMNVAPDDIMPRAHMLYWASIGHMMLPENSDVRLSVKQLDRFTNLIVS